MNCSDGNIEHLSEGRIAELREHDELKHFAPIDEADLPKVRKMNKGRRKNWMRNKPCPCGSGDKFKKCCWSKYT